MASFFIDLFNMSITASYLVLAVVVARFVLKKAPKWINCLLWALVGIRLVCPFSFESALSLIPSSETIALNDSSTGRPFTVQSGVSAVDLSVNELLGDKYYEGVTVPVNTFTDMTTVLSVVWFVGLFVMLLYGLVSFIRIRKRVGASLLFKDNIYFCDNIDTPFILGLFKPKIYIPSGLNEEQVDYITLHENAHLKRKDHFWKPLGFILLSVYWFNPAIWVAYTLLCRDIEIACDERVIKNMPNIEKKGYSETLVSCSVQRRTVMACPLAFGEVEVKQRIKSVLNYKKPTFWVTVFAVLLIAVVGICFLTNPHGDNSSIGIIGGADGPTSIIVSDNKNEKMGTPTHIYGDFYQAVIDLKSELKVYGLYYWDKATGDFHLVDTIGTVSPYFAVQEEALYYTSDYRLKSISLKGDFKITIYTGSNNSLEQEYSIERIELVKDGKIYCEAKNLNETETVYIAVNADNSSFNEISKNDIPIDESQFEAILSNIKTTLDTDYENILVKNFRIKYTLTGNIEEALFNVWIYNGTKNNEDFWIEGNVLVTFDNNVFFNVINEEIVLLSEYNPKKEGSLQTIDDIMEKVKTAVLQTPNVDKEAVRPEQYLLTMGAMPENEKYVKYVAELNPEVEYMQEKNGRFVSASKPLDLTLETYEPVNKMYFILVPEYPKDSVQNYIFEENESTVSGNFKVLLFDK